MHHEEHEGHEENDNLDAITGRLISHSLLKRDQTNTALTFKTPCFLVRRGVMPLSLTAKALYQAFQ